MKAGRNTPQSVLSYIAAIEARNVPEDPAQIARELGYGPKRYRVLKEKHGKDLLAHLKKARRLRTESKRHLHMRIRDNDPANMMTIVPVNDVPPNPPEPERISKEDEDRYGRLSCDNMEVLKAEENMRREARSRAEKLRQHEMELRREGISPARQLAVIDAAIEELRQMRRNGNSP